MVEVGLVPMKNVLGDAVKWFHIFKHSGWGEWNDSYFSNVEEHRNQDGYVLIMVYLDWK